MNPRETIVGAADLTSEQHALVRDVLRSILDSSHFRRSKRYPAFLEFVVSNTLSGNTHLLRKERVLAEEVFGRSSDYDPSNDAVVRYTAGEVRKRMALYFSEHPEAPLRIELPLGSYIAEFHFALPIPAAAELVLDPVDLAELAHPLETHEIVHTDFEIKLPPARAKIWMGASLASGLLLAVGAAALWTQTHNRAKQEFWWPVLHNNTPAVIVVGEQANPIPVAAAETAFPAPLASPDQTLNLNPSFLDENGLLLGNAVAVTQVCNAFRSSGRECKILPSQSAPFTELHNNSVVLIGAFDNILTKRYLSNLRFQFQADWAQSGTVIQTRKIVDKSKPGDNTAWAITAERPIGPTSTDYAIVARYRCDLNDGMIVVVAGLGPQGTHSAGDFISSPGTDAMREIASQAPRNWKGVNFEAVLQIDVVQGSSGHARVIATQYW